MAEHDIGGLTLDEQLQAHKLERFRRSAVEKYPDVEPFVDLITEDTEEAFHDTARELARRSAAVRVAAAPPVDPIKDAIQRKDFLGYLKLTRERALRQARGSVE